MNNIGGEVILEVIKDLPPDIIGFKASGFVREEDYKNVLIPKVEELYESGKEITMLYHFTPKFEGFFVGAAWQDFRISLRHLCLLRKIAVVSDIPELGEELSKHFIYAEVKNFAYYETD